MYIYIYIANETYEYIKSLKCVINLKVLEIQCNIGGADATYRQICIGKGCSTDRFIATLVLLHSHTHTHDIMKKC